MAALLTACGGSDEPELPRLAEARPAALAGSCDALSARFGYAGATITAATAVEDGALRVAGQPIPAHCRITGSMLERLSAVDGKSYAIGFEMRLPLQWNGRFFYQANGGIDGNVTPALGPVGGGGPLSNALRMGFAVISSDAGHSGRMGPFFGLDPQARLDYGYQAVAKLTPMAKALIASAYGKPPDRSYIGGCSNGGRHTMVAAARYADQYDGFLVGNPGYRLPLAAIANIRGAQVYHALADGDEDLGQGFTLAERKLVSRAVLARCDVLDGAADGIVADGVACQREFMLSRDVPTCRGERHGACLSSAQKSAIAQLFAGATTPEGVRIYTSFPWDNGLDTGNWASWKFNAPLMLDSGAVGLIWQTPPEDPTSFAGPAFALNGNVGDMLAKVQATNALYTESALSFMLPPHATDLAGLRDRGAKVIVYHGTADPIFSSDDTRAWYDELTRANDGKAERFARYFPVPGMNHCAGGPSTDQFDMLAPLVEWVERGRAPDFVLASVRGADNPAGANPDVPTGWSAVRTRPLCPFPEVAVYKGSGSMEDAASFACQRR